MKIRGGSDRMARRRATAHRKVIRIASVLALGGSVGSGLAARIRPGRLGEYRHRDELLRVGVGCGISLPAVVAAAAPGDMINFSLGGSCSLISLSSHASKSLKA